MKVKGVEYWRARLGSRFTGGQVQVKHFQALEDARKWALGDAQKKKAKTGLSMTRRKQGAPDDYISSLLPDVLGKFSAIYPCVTLELICAPSAVLAPMLADKKLDMAFFSRGSRTKGFFIRFEPMVWAGTEEAQAWLNKPLPIAIFEKGCVSRLHAERSLKGSQID